MIDIYIETFFYFHYLIYIFVTLKFETTCQQI